MLFPIALATLIPVGGVSPRFDPRIDLADAVVNLALFLPLGFVIAHGRGRWTRAVAIALVASLSIELLQGLVIPGRRGSPADVALNVLGALLGFHARRAIWIAGALFLPGWLASGAMLAPCAPDTPVWWGQLAHHFGGTEPFTGKLLRARFQVRDVPDGAIAVTPMLLNQARRSGFVLEIDLVAGPAVDTRAHLAGISDGRGNTIIAMERAGDDLLLHWLSRAACSGFRPGRALLPNAFAGVGRDTVTVRAEVDAGTVRMTLASSRQESTRAIRLLPPAGWRSMYSLSRPRQWVELALTVLWCAAAAGLAAFLVIRLRPRRQRPISY